MIFNILGAGAIGSFLASKLEEIGHTVNLISIHRSKAEIELIQKTGIKCFYIGNNSQNKADYIFYNVISINNVLPQSDYMIICLKAQQLEDTLSKITANCKYIMSIMNGYGYFHILDEFRGNIPLIIASTRLGVTNVPINKILQLGNGVTYIADYIYNADTSISIAYKSTNIFNEAKIKSSYKESYKDILLKKLLINSVINPITAIWNIDNGEILANTERINLVNNLTKEAIEVLVKEGIHWTYEEAMDLIRKIADSTSKNTSSMRQDILSGRETELDYINGALVNLARKHNIKLPVNEEIIYRIKTLSNNLA